jgi:IS30 family transposase
MSKHTAAVINERRQKLWTLLTRGMNRYEIAKELGTDHSTISRDIKYLTAVSELFE